MFTCENIRKNATGKQEQGEKEGGKQTVGIKESDKADIKKLNEKTGDSKEFRKIKVQRYH